MRILLLCYEFPPLGGGGAKVVAGLSSELVRLGHDVDLVTMGYQGLPESERVEGVSVHRVSRVRWTPVQCTIPEAALYVLCAIPAVWRLVRQKHFDLIHAHFVFPDGLIAWLMHRLSGVPYLLTAHGSDVPGYNPHRLARAHRLLAPCWQAVIGGARLVISPSRVLEALICRQGPSVPIIVVPNGIDVGRFRWEAPKSRRVLLVTRMLERKGVQYVLEALERVPIDHEVHIVGDGPFLPTLRRMAQARNLQVKFWGWLDNRSEQLTSLYESSSIFLLPSEAENFPVALLEAMAAGLAIITTAGTGCAEVVGETAILVPPKDPSAIAEALRRLVEDTGLCRRLGQAARRRLEECFSWPAVAEQHLALYRQVHQGEAVVGVDDVLIERPAARAGLQSMPGDEHQVSIVVPTLGHPNLQRCLEALRRQTRVPDEIIIVRDTHRRGAAWARNRGVRRAGGDLIAFTDDDCVVPPEWLARLISAIDRFGADGAGTTFCEEDPFLQAVRRGRRPFPQEETVDMVGVVGSGGSTVYRRAQLDACTAHDGYVFNEAFRTSQDWELAWRMRRGGAKLVFVPVLVTHCRRVGLNSYFRMQFRRGIGIAMLFRLQRNRDEGAPVHDSLLWGAQGRPHPPRWWPAIWRKVVGPFDWQRIGCGRYFWRYWLGEKLQGAGFLWGMLRRHPLRPRAVGPCRERPMTPPAAPVDRIPTFSIVVETENLAATDPEHLVRCLDDLARQDLSPAAANEVLLFESGDVPAALLARLRQAYPWLQVERLDAGDGYFEVKMAGARRATGELIVLYDSDCRYPPHWLRSMLLPFARNPGLAVLTGETSVRITGPHSLATILTWSFPAFSRRTRLYQVAAYNANGAVLRRDVLLACPIPDRMAVYRGNGAVHNVLLRQRGYIIWCQPEARVTHPMPAEGLIPCVWRWLLYGHDQLLTEQVVYERRLGSGWLAWGLGGAVGFLKILSLVSWKPLRRLPRTLAEDPRRVCWLPAAAVVLLSTTLIALAGFLLALVCPGALLRQGVARLKGSGAVRPQEATA